jgi:hypothetical protein
MDQGTLWMERSLVQGNRAIGPEWGTPAGGGLRLLDSVGGFIGTTEFIGNVTSDPVTRPLGKGGAIASDSNRLQGEGLLFLENWAGEAGGAVWGPITLRDSVLRANLSHSQGGGAWGAMLFDSELVANRVIPLDDWDSTWGGGAYGGFLSGCTLRDNVAYGFKGPADQASCTAAPASFGGGAYAATLVHCLVYDNHADFGGGLANCDANVTTVFCNTALAEAGGGGLFFDGLGQVQNSIIWHNMPNQILDFTDTISVTYSDVELGWPGQGNANWDPMFWDPAARDFHLKPSSYCIDRGDPLAPPDPDGTRCDMGALCFDAQYCGLPSTYCDAKVNSMDCVPSIAFIGTPSLTGPDDFHITAHRVLNQRNGMLIWSYLAADLPFRGGTLCISSPLVRTEVQSSGGSALPANDCSGTFDHLYSQAEMGQRFMWVGRTFFAQYYYRDEGFAAPDNVGLTDGLRVTVCP